jgi:hypothetical protein
MSGAGVGEHSQAVTRKTHHKHSSSKGYRRLLDGLAEIEGVHRVATGKVKPRMGSGRPVAAISKVRRVPSGLSIPRRSLRRSTSAVGAPPTRRPSGATESASSAVYIHRLVPPTLANGKICYVESRQPTSIARPPSTTRYSAGASGGAATVTPRSTIRRAR